MLDFFFRPEQVEFVSLVDRQLTFQCKRKYKMGSPIRVRVSIPNPASPSGREMLTLPVSLSSLRPVTDRKKTYVCTGEVPVAATALDHLNTLLQAGDPNEGTRRRTRHRYALRMVSKELPGFRALSIDFNPLGLQIQTEGPAPVGSILTLDIELELQSMPRVLCQAKVCWCRQMDRKRHLIGLEFVELPEEIGRELETFEQVLLANQSRSVMHKQLNIGNDLILSEMDPSAIAVFRDAAAPEDK